MRIRPIALGLIWNERRLLVEHGFDSLTGRRFFRPPGGEIEFGERAVDALRREFLEELDAELSEPRLVTVVESLFEYEGQPHHEVVFVFEARFEEPRLYRQSEFTIREAGVNGKASWKPVDALLRDDTPLYPAGLRALVAGR